MSTSKDTVNAPRETRIRSIGLISIGLICGILGSYGWAAMSPPTEHKGLEVEQLGFVPGESVSAQVGLTGYKLLLRKISIMPGGQIAKHSHATSPGVVYIDSGAWNRRARNRRDNLLSWRHPCRGYKYCSLVLQSWRHACYCLCVRH